MRTGACKDVCPGKIDIPGLIMELRRRLVKDQGVVNNQRIFHGMLRTASIAGKPFSKGTKFIRHLPMFLANLTDGRSRPAIAAKPFRDVFKSIAQPKNLQEKTVFYGGCLIDFAYPEMGEALVKIMNRTGIEVLFPEGQTCCCAPALNHEFITTFDSLGQSKIMPRTLELAAKTVDFSKLVKKLAKGD